MLKWTTADL